MGELPLIKQIIIMKRIIKNTLSWINQLSNRKKYISIFLVWGAVGLYVISFFLSGQGDSLGLLPIAFILYYFLWLSGGGVLALGIFVYRKVNKMYSVLLFIISIALLQPVLSRFYNSASHSLYNEAIRYNIITADALIDELRNGKPPEQVVFDIQRSLYNHKDASPHNVEWLLSHCLKEKNRCYYALFGLFDSGLVTKEQIMKAYDSVKDGKNNPCYNINKHRQYTDLVHYHLTPKEILYDLRNYCSGSDLKYINWRIKCLESPNRKLYKHYNQLNCGLIEKSPP